MTIAVPTSKPDRLTRETLNNVHWQMARSFAEWTARSGSPVKSRSEIYPALRKVPFERLSDPNRGPILVGDFDEWHHTAVDQLCESLPLLCAGWAAKLVNVYLKTRAYLPADGRPGLLDPLHPPIDGGSWQGIALRFVADGE